MRQGDFVLTSKAQASMIGLRPKARLPAREAVGVSLGDAVGLRRWASKRDIGEEMSVLAGLFAQAEAGEKAVAVEGEAEASAAKRATGATAAPVPRDLLRRSPPEVKYLSF